MIDFWLGEGMGRSDRAVTGARKASVMVHPTTAGLAWAMAIRPCGLGWRGFTRGFVGALFLYTITQKVDLTAVSSCGCCEDKTRAECE
jgi:hypothetical protein